MIAAAVNGTVSSLQLHRKKAGPKAGLGSWARIGQDVVGTREGEHGRVAGAESGEGGLAGRGLGWRSGKTQEHVAEDCQRAEWAWLVGHLLKQSSRWEQLQ